MFTLSDLFDIAVKMEKNGKTLYLKAKEAVKNSRMQELLEWMAQEEENHRQWFSKKQANVPLDQDEKKLKQMVPDTLEEMIGENTLSLDEVDFRGITSLSELLRTFIEFEEDTVMFYELLEIYIEDTTTLKGLESIIAEEKSHVEKLTVMLQAITENTEPEEAVTLSLID